uniref:Small EDRK-rich factor-like N-terminal domain-containing protein n=1 Tax=Picea sitchensis TaxID=3332 RepID=A9P0W2_PICSI|nr:unknown [Picea sitchensis]
MGGGNGQKAKMAREKNNEKNKAPKGSQLETNKKAMSIQYCGHLLHFYELLKSIVVDHFGFCTQYVT